MTSIEAQVLQPYKYGFVTDIESEDVPLGLNEDIVRLISRKKEEPAFLLEWRLKAYRHWLTLTELTWANIHHAPIDYQASRYYSAPKQQKKLDSLDQVDPKLIETFDKLGIPLAEQKRLSGVAVDARISDSVSVATTFKAELAKYGIIFCAFSDAVKNHPDLIEKWLADVVPASDNFFAALNSAVFSDGSFCYIPKGVRCPLELSTYFRINASSTGQFERTLIIADEGSHVSYLEGCSAPVRDENWLHAAVVELIALDEATINYSTIQNWYPGDENGKGGIYNFVTKRGACRGRNSKISWTQVETGSAITWKYPGCDPAGRQLDRRAPHSGGGVDQQLPAGRHAAPRCDPHGRRSLAPPIVSKWRVAPQEGTEHVPRPREDSQGRRGRAELFAVRFDADRGPVRRAHLPLHRRPELVGHHGTRGLDVQDRRGPGSSTASSGGCFAEDAVSLIVNGFCKEVFKELLMEFAVAWLKPPRHLCSKGASGESAALLEITGPHGHRGGRREKRDPSGSRPLRSRPARCNAIMGPNGSGKSTLAAELAGHPAYAVTGGTVTYRGKDLLDMAPEERAREGVFLAFQYPVAIRGITNSYFLRSALNAVRKHRGQEELDPLDFLSVLEKRLKQIGWDDSFLNRAVNDGFSGGEKKRNEILQMAVLEPTLAVLDETDSGLDIDALKTVAEAVNARRGAPDNATVVVTHYQRLLNYIVPDRVHVLAGGRIVKSGGKELALELEEKGYVGV